MELLLTLLVLQIVLPGMTLVMTHDVAQSSVRDFCTVLVQQDMHFSVSFINEGTKKYTQVCKISFIIFDKLMKF
jgi:hypothetical protein